jgi:hypothetical protein
LKYVTLLLGLAIVLASIAVARAQANIIPPPPPPPQPFAPPPAPLGWVYLPYTVCGDPPACSFGVVNVSADGLNVRTAPNGPPIMALVNGTPLVPLQQAGNWVLVAPACSLTSTFLWSWTAGVPLNRCWIY